MAKAKRMIEEKKMFSIGKILSIIVIILVIIVVIFLRRKTNIAEDPVNEAEKHIEEIKQEKTFENLTIKNIDIKYENGNSFFKLELANESDTDFQGRNIKIIFPKEDGTNFATIKYNLTNIKSKESFYINTSTNVDLTQASDFYIESE